MPSWARYFLLGDLGQHEDLNDAQEDVARLRGRLHRQAAADRDQNHRIAELEADVDELRVIVGELTRLLVGGGSLSEDAVARLVDVVEAARQPPSSQPPLTFEPPPSDEPPPPRRFR
jgi:hypothetical protein